MIRMNGNGAIREKKGNMMAKQQNNGIDISENDFGKLCICAIRYCHGRQTYMPSLIQRICMAHLQEFSDETLSVMIYDCEFQERMHLYGDEQIDKPRWLAWKDVLLAEKRRRNEKAN